jgi:hypothetical protein
MPAVRSTVRGVTVALVLAVLATAASPAYAARPERGSVEITSPADGASGTSVLIPVAGKATSPDGQVYLSVDGTSTDFPVAVSSKGTWSTTVGALSLGAHQICAEVISTGGTQLASDCVSYTVQPDLSRFDVDWPLEGGSVLTLFQVQGSCQDGTEVVVALDQEAPVTAVCDNGYWYAQYLTTAGAHTVTATLTYAGQALATVHRSFTATAPPAVDIRITSPSDGTIVSTSSVGVTGTTNQPETAITLTVNEGDPRETYTDFDGTWQGYASLSYGENVICVTASDLYGTSDRECVTVTFAIDPALLTLTSPQDGDVSNTFVYYDGSCFTGTQVRIELDGELYREDTCYYDHFGGAIPYVPDGEHVLTATMLWEGTPIAGVSSSVFVDTLAPAPPTVLSPAPGGTIRSVPVTISGTAEAGATVELVGSAGEAAYSAPVGTDGTWSMTLDRAYLESLGVVTGQRQTLRLRFETVDAALNRSAPTFATYTVRAR